MNLSDKGRAFIRDYEKVMPRAYKDSAGKWTIGIGHLITEREQDTGVVRIDGHPILWRTANLTDAQMDALFRQDLAPRVDALNRLLTRPAKQHEFDAMLSLLFNIGEGGFTKSSVRRYVNAGLTRDAADAFLLWNKETVNGKKRVNRGLTKRREQERAMFLHGKCDSTH